MLIPMAMYDEAAMRFKDNQVIYKSDLNDFDLHDRRVNSPEDARIYEPDKPIGIYRTIYKNGIEVTHWIQPII